MEILEKFALLVQTQGEIQNNEKENRVLLASEMLSRTQWLNNYLRDKELNIA